MKANNYLKLACYMPAADGEARHVTSRVFPFDSASGASRVRALIALHAASDEPRPQGTALQTSVWRRMPGYEFPVVGALEMRETLETEGTEEE